MAPCWLVAVLTVTSSMSVSVKGTLFSPKMLFLSLKTAVIMPQNPDKNKLAALISGVISSSSGLWDEMEMVISKSAVKTTAVTVSSSPGGGHPVVKQEEAETSGRDPDVGLIK